MTNAATATAKADFINKTLGTDFAVKPGDLVLGVGGGAVTGALIVYAIDAFTMATSIFSMPVLIGVAYTAVAFLAFQFAVFHLILAFKQ